MVNPSKDAKAALNFLPRLVVLKGRLAGRNLKLASYQKKFVRGAFANGVENACLSISRVIGKRGERALIISTSAPNDTHPFSKWIDELQEGVYIQEHRPTPGLPADDRESLLEANPGVKHGIGSSVEWLETQARDWIGYAIADFIGWDAHDNTDKARLKSIIKIWVKNDALKVIKIVGDDRKERPVMEVGQWAD